MVTKTNKDNQTNKQNPLVDTGTVTVNAFNILQNKKKSDDNFILGQSEKSPTNSPNFKVKVKAWTQDDKKTHKYFHSLSIDVNVEDFMGTAELKCPYDSDLMEYWEPIRQTVVIYGANKGDYKILFIGRVRELKQDGYELVITFQNYGWKFKQLVTQSYANDNVLNKDGLTIMKLMFEALKIDSYVISKSAEMRLKQVGINSDGNLTLNGAEIEEMPDLIERLKESDPSKLVNKDTLKNKLKESELHNIKNINYTLKYEKPTPVMQKIAGQGDFSAGNTVYANPYASASGGGSGTGTGSDGNAYIGGTGCSTTVSSFCSQCSDSTLQAGLLTVWMFNRDCVNSYSDAYSSIVGFARAHPATYSSQAAPCLATMSQYTKRADGQNAASVILSAAGTTATISGGIQYVAKEATRRVSVAQNHWNTGMDLAKQRWNQGDYAGALGQAGWTGLRSLGGLVFGR